MKRTLGIALFTAALVATGCAKRSELDSVKEQLAACERDKAVADAKVAACESGMDQERQRWDAIETELKTVLPETVRSFEEERARLIALVPDEVKREVGERFDRYVSRMTKEFASVHQELQDMKTQLEGANVQLGDIKTTTTRIDTKVDTNQADLADQNRALHGRITEQGKIAEQVVAQILDFDKKHVNCKTCVTGIKMKDRTREVLSQFHGQLIQDLQEIGTVKSTKVQ